MSFAASLCDLPTYFAGEGDLIMSHTLASLSGVFPDGEEYFVRSVRHFRDEITDPELKRQVAGFIGQEAVHGREHRALNDRLAELGYPTKQIERLHCADSNFERHMTPLGNLASTAALEHFTATLAEVILSSERVREDHEASTRSPTCWSGMPSRSRSTRRSPSTCIAPPAGRSEPVDGP